mmetsp:Transcript_6874/g.14138  ORF Transcript_6874/g.14138 Transcript_6874/m.14138 type:complete len:92 (+) Transcript_6874:52-327(+)
MDRDDVGKEGAVVGSRVCNRIGFERRVHFTRRTLDEENSAQDDSLDLPEVNAEEARETSPDYSTEDCREPRQNGTHEGKPAVDPPSIQSIA